MHLQTVVTALVLFAAGAGPAAAHPGHFTGAAPHMFTEHGLWLLLAAPVVIVLLRRRARRVRAANRRPRAQ